MVIKLIIFLLLVTRFLFLDRIPTGINDDELHFVLNSKSFFLQQNDVYHSYSNPLKALINSIFTETTTPFFSPILGVLPTNLFYARLPYVLISILSIYLLYLITLKFTSQKKLALTTAIVATVNPWMIYVSRTSFDAPVALFFYLLSIYLLFSPQKRNIYLSIFTGIFAFGSYIGTKILYFPVILITSVYSYKLDKKNFYPRLTAVVICFIITILFTINLKNSSLANRSLELSTPFSDQIKKEVQVSKDMSLQSPFKPFFSNIYIQYLKNFAGKYLTNFSSELLFVNGDKTFTGSLWQHGYFYYLDLPLLFLGLIFLYQHYPYYLAYLCLLISLSPIPEAIRSDKIPAYVFHSVLIYPLLVIIISMGVFDIYQRTLKHKIVWKTFIAIYAILFLNFIDVYFFKSPVYQPESFAFSRRLAIRSAFIQSQNDDVYVLVPDVDTFFRSYLFYTGYSSQNLSQVNQIYQQSKDFINYNKIHITNDIKNVPQNKLTKIIADKSYRPIIDSSQLIEIKTLSDNSTQYQLFNFNFCQDTELSFFSSHLNFFDLNIEKLPPAIFCKKYISTPN